MNIASINNTTQQSPLFKAIIVKKLQPILRQEGITFYNNGSAVLNRPCNLFEGGIQLIRNIMQNQEERINTILDVLDLNRFEKMTKFLPRQIFGHRILHGIVGTGMNTTALRLNKDEILCLSDNMEIFQERPFEEFDLPMRAMGMYNENDIHSGWYIRDLGMPINKHELERLGRIITSKGYNLDDWRIEQGCKLNNKLYLLDFECAQTLEQEMKHLMDNYC